MRQQEVSSQKGEIKFRKQLIKQQIDGELIFEDEFNADGIEKILIARMTKTLAQMTELRQRKINISPYLEIGAERCQRSLVMENDLNSIGAAIDISYDALKSGTYYSKTFNKNKIPLRICCDANNLPVLSNSVPFVFCYETLHHFPNPIPILKEIHRVLTPGGFFFIDEEPFKRLLKIPLYMGKKIYSKGYQESSKLRSILDYYFSKLSCNEIEYNIIENYGIPLSIWRKGFNLFNKVEIYLDTAIKLINSDKIVRTELYNPNNFFKFVLAFLFGGVLFGTCQKAGSINEAQNEISIYDLLACPSCIENGYESKIIQENLLFFCKSCSTKFPVIDDIIFLLSHKKLKELYPELYKKYL